MHTLISFDDEPPLFDDQPPLKDMISLNLYALSEEKLANQRYFYLFITHRIWNMMYNVKNDVPHFTFYDFVE